MYHAVSPQITGATNINPVHIPLSSFIDQMRWLKNEGYQTLSIEELLIYKKYKKELSKKVVLTFDDGYLSLLEHVTKVLKENNFKATLFLTTASVGSKSYNELSHLGKSYPENDRPLNWRELQEMEQLGWSIEAHGHEHRVHNMLPEQELKFEMEMCKQLIDQNLNTSCSHYSFPWGRYNMLCLKSLEELTSFRGFRFNRVL